jgi:Family of unknown function (DUF6496)
MAKYGKAASESVKKALHREKRGTLLSGKKGRGGVVRSRKQAIAIGLSEAPKRAPKFPAKTQAEGIFTFLMSRGGPQFARNPFRIVRSNWAPDRTPFFIVSDQVGSLQIILCIRKERVTGM